MLLRTTKKFFQRTVESFKSFISGGYQRLPKSPPCNSFPCGGGAGSIRVDHIKKYRKSYTEVSKSRSRAEIIPRKDNDQMIQMQGDAERHSKKKIVYHGKSFYSSRSSTPQALERQRNTLLVAKKLKELEMMDNGNVEHVLDVEEVLHYYSMLTLPAYVDIVDQFFMDVYSELLSGRASSRFHSSRPMIQRVGY